MDGISLLDKPESSTIRLVAGASWAFGGKAVSATSVVAINALLAHLCPPAEIGNYFLLQSLVVVTAVLAQLGLGQTATRLVASFLGAGQTSQIRGAIHSVFYWGVAGGIIVGVPFCFIVRWLGFEIDLSVISMLWMIGLAWQTLLAETLRGFHDIRKATIFGGVLTNLVICGMLLGWWLWQGKSTLEVPLILRVLGEAVSILLAAIALSRVYHSHVPARDSGIPILENQILVLAFPVMISNLVLFSFSQVDIWILGILQTPFDLAVYGAAAKLVVLISLPLLTLNSVLAPIIAELHARRQRARLERTLRAVAGLACLPAVLIFLALTFFGGPILRFLYGDPYESGAILLMILGMGQIFIVITGPCALTLLMTGRQKLLMNISILSGVLTVLMAVALVLSFGSLGVAVAIATGTIGQNLLMLFSAKRTLGIWTYPRLSDIRHLPLLYAKLKNWGAEIAT